MKKLIAIGLSASLFACASTNTSEYLKADDSDDYGYYESKLTNNRYRVNFNGNRNTSRDEVKDMALLRAAELTLLNEHDWFRVITQETEKEVRNTPRAATTLGAGQRVSRSCGLLGCTTTVSPAYTQIQVATGPVRNSYSTSIEVVMGDGEVGMDSTAYNASELYSYLEGRY